MLAIAKAEAEIVLALNHVSDGVGEVRGLAAIQRCRAIAEAAEVCEREIGRALIERRLIGPGDTELAFDVRFVREERRALADVAAEGERRVVVEARLEAVAPAGGCAHAVAARRYP